MVAGAAGTTRRARLFVWLNHCKGVFSYGNFWLWATVTLSFEFSKNYLIIDYLDLKDSSRQLQSNCKISYSFYLHLMLHACTARFDVTGNLENFWFLGGI